MGVKNILVGENDDICTCDATFREVVGTNTVLFAQLYEIFDVQARLRGCRLFNSCVNHVDNWIKLFVPERSWSMHTDLLTEIVRTS